MNQNDDKNMNSKGDKSLSGEGFLEKYALEDSVSFSVRKTEKIVQALYLVTSHLDDNEPLKFEIREKGLALLSFSLALNSANVYDKNSLTSSLLSSLFEISSFLRLAMVSGNISRSNFTLLFEEIQIVSSLITDETKQKGLSGGLILSKDFFYEQTEIGHKNDKGQISLKNNNYKHLDSVDTPKNKDSIKDRKNDRQVEIINLLKRQSKLTIKDFSKVIIGCSEKTIQRELIELVEKGLVIREGERRWSRYSLK